MAFRKPGREEALAALIGIMEKYEVPPRTLTDPDSEEGAQYWESVIDSCNAWANRYSDDKMMLELLLAWFGFVDKTAAQRIQQARNTKQEGSDAT